MLLIRAARRGLGTKRCFWLELKYKDLIVEEPASFRAALSKANNIEDVTYLYRKAAFTKAIERNEQHFAEEQAALIETFNRLLQETHIAEFRLAESAHAFLRSLETMGPDIMELIAFHDILEIFERLFRREFRFWKPAQRTSFTNFYLYVLRLWLQVQTRYIAKEDLSEKLLASFFDSREFLQFFLFNTRFTNSKPRAIQLLDRFASFKHALRSPFALARRLFAGVSERPFGFYVEDWHTWLEAFQILESLTLMSRIEPFEVEEIVPVGETASDQASAGFVSQYFQNEIAVWLSRFLVAFHEAMGAALETAAATEFGNTLTEENVGFRLGEIHRVLVEGKLYGEVSESERIAVERLLENYLGYRLAPSDEEEN